MIETCTKSVLQNVDVSHQIDFFCQYVRVEIWSDGHFTQVISSYMLMHVFDTLANLFDKVGSLRLSQGEVGAHHFFK